MTQPFPRILYIDDDEGLRRLVKRALDRRGYLVELAAGGDEGVERASRESFDLIAVDHYMPGLDGLTTLARLNALPTPPPVVYVSGSEETPVAVAALKAGAADYVVKTVGDEFFDLLDSTFQQALEQMRLRREKEAVEQTLRDTIERQAMLLREVNHRVANSLQLVSSFVSLQASQGGDETRHALKSIQNRVSAIMQVHRRLYTSDDVLSVDVHEYLEALIDELGATCATGKGQRPLRLTAAPVRLPTDKVVSLGMIVAELVTNACKYAYPPDDDGEVRVALRVLPGGRAALEVEDDGPGMDFFAEAQGTGLGRRVIAAMAKSLRGELIADPAHSGARIRLEFPT